MDLATPHDQLRRPGHASRRPHGAALVVFGMVICAQKWHESQMLWSVQDLDPAFQKLANTDYSPCKCLAAALDEKDVLELLVESCNAAAELAVAAITIEDETIFHK
ncbi:hypothetical protein QVD17_34467 [Tagetes erecta]|uniref:Uncharacterized protein n=1 Tax=Tagetes erecta TaxID=13708 RepID=A0AAD8K0N4_TARER|nr:hypothetical protein QVD17_34467 [Tagetes erecta]